MQAAQTPPPDPTHSHLLSLPPLLHPISPSLAALHMARVRLLLDIPASTSVGVMSEWWCHACGGLREGLGGAGPKRRGVGKAKSNGGAGGAKGKAKKGTGKGMNVGTIPTLGLAVGKRRDAKCVNCGERFGKPKPDKATLITYPSARIAARTRRSVAVASEGAGPSASGTTATASASAPLIPSNEAGPSTPLSNGSAPTPAASTPSTTTTKPTSLPNEANPTLHNPSKPNFTRVKTTEPNLPTYPPPASSTSTSPEKGGSKKRKKKSGLAKLLAENKERAAAQNMGGTWGLG